MGQYGNQPDFGTKGIAITPSGFASGGYVNVKYYDDEENLQTVNLTSKSLNVSTLADGTPIAQAIDAASWIDFCDNKIAAWAYPAYEEENGKKFGKIYNRYAIENGGLLDPGYEITPLSLIDFFSNGLNPTLGKQLKSKLTGTDGEDLQGTIKWTYNDITYNGTDIFGFTGLPGGRIDGDGVWQEENNIVSFWTDDYETPTAWNLGYKSLEVVEGIYSSYFGFYIRLVVDPKNTDYNIPQPLNSAALYVGTGGDLVVTIVGSEEPVIFKNVANGSFLPIIVTNVWERADIGVTTCSDIIALY